ncbi:hypothetical protein QF040_001504 [Variovorax sp. W2I14]
MLFSIIIGPLMTPDLDITGNLYPVAAVIFMYAAAA